MEGGRRIGKNNLRKDNFLFKKFLDLGGIDVFQGGVHKNRRLAWMVGTVGILAAPVMMAQNEAAVSSRPATTTATAPADDPAAEMRRELDAMRSEYEARIKKLEARLAQIEKERSATPEPQPRRAPAPRQATSDVQRAAEAAGMDREKATSLVKLRQDANAEFMGNTEIREMTRYPDSERLLGKRFEDILEGYMEITGYFRAGYGRSDKKTPLRAFGIPGVKKYRLGNEAENYGEISFQKTFFRSGYFTADGEPDYDGPVAHFETMISYINGYDNYGSAADTDFSVPQIWGSVANVIPSMPYVKFWAGNRYYRRHDVHINDYYFWDMSGGGGGVEDIPLGPGKLAIAYIGDGAQSAIYERIGQPDPLNNAGFSKTNLDVRYYDWPLFGGKGELGLAYSHTTSGRDINGVSAPSSDGFSVSLVRTKENFCEGWDSLHKTSLQFGTGPAKTFTSTFETFQGPYFDKSGKIVYGTFVRPDPNESWRFRFTDQWVFRPLEQLSVGTMMGYQYTEYGDYAPYQQWATAGIRPIWHFTDSFNIALEAGVDWVSRSTWTTPYGGAIIPARRGGMLGKITLAPEISFGDQFFSRPVIRAFVTYGFWGSGLEGQVGGGDYAQETSGLSWGLQMETWW